MLRRRVLFPFLFFSKDSHSVVTVPRSIFSVSNPKTFDYNLKVRSVFSSAGLRTSMSSPFQHEHFLSTVHVSSTDIPYSSTFTQTRNYRSADSGARGAKEKPTGPIPSSTNLTIGDVVVPIPDYSISPERVSWVLPGIDYTLEPLLAAVAANLNSSSSTYAKDLSKLSQNQENLFFSLRDPVTRSHLRWLCQKELLGQDMCLIGDPGPAMRWLIYLYSYLTRREVRTVFLNRDVTESDLKQRREIRNGTLIYEDQSAVTAAKEGQLLVLEGLERVERNVLPVINNLLENREMHLDNGQVLIHPARYDSLLNDIVNEKMRKAGLSEGKDNAAEMKNMVEDGKKELELMGLLRVSEKFRVIGITVPVPPYEGNPLDPPLRSRFQCLYVRTPLPTIPSAASSLNLSAVAFGQKKKKVDDEVNIVSEKLQADMDARMDSITQMRLTIDAVNASTSEFRNSSKEGGTDAVGENESMGSSSSLQNIGNYELGMIAKQLFTYPNVPLGEILTRGFPWQLYSKQLPGGNTTSSVGMEEIRRRFTEYMKIFGRCNLAPPLLLTSSVLPEDKSSNASSSSSSPSFSNPVSPRGGRANPPSSSTSKLTEASKQASAALKAVLDGFTKTGTTAEKVKSYLISGKLTENGNVKDNTIKEVEEFCNYFREIDNIRSFQFSSLDEEDAAAGKGCGPDVVVADARIATSTHGEKDFKRGSGVYTLPIYMGNNAPLMYKDSSVRIAEVCPSEKTVFTTAHYHVLQTMLQCHGARQHIALIGSTGCGKTALIREFSRLLGYEKETTHLYADMTNKDFFQRRTTDAKTGNTTWENAALVEAAIHGKLVVLDGIDKLPFGMLTSLQQVLIDQNANLFDGTVLKAPQEYKILRQKMGLSDEEMRAQRIFPIHPAFRVIATARPPGENASGSQGKPFSISQDVTALFSVITMPDASEATLEPVLLQVAEREMQDMLEAGLPIPQNSGNSKKTIHSLLRLRTELDTIRLTDPKVPQLTFRQLLHLAKNAVRYPNDTVTSISSALLFPLMSGVSATQVTHALKNCGFNIEKNLTLEEEVLTQGQADEKKGITSVFNINGAPTLILKRNYTKMELALVPFVTGFHPNKIHESIIAWLGKQYAMKSNILLIGNQGVGKNKVVDAFLSRIQIPRHYIQLHRDTTVGSLTINPTVEGGKVRWEDSPLVKAVQQGHCLVVDEIDKASVEVVQVLKGLIEDHEMRLGDGRQIVEQAFYDQMKARNSDVSQMIPIHEDFRMIVLANPPGFPFHGNDFFRECGDLFASYVMSNPDGASQLRVLAAYGPNIPHSVLRRLINAFEKLQEAFQEGNITYPFSLRELIAVVKHMSRYPQDGVYQALNNVFNFDARDDNTLRLVRSVLNTYLVQSIEKMGGMKNAYPLHIGQPKPHKPHTELLPVPLPKTDKKEFAQVLTCNTIKNASQVRDAIFSYKSLTQQNPFKTYCWKVNYQENDFFAEPLKHKDQTHWADWFTEWTGTQKVPFVDPATDKVLSVLPVGTFETNDSTSCLVSFLIEHNNKLLLATALFPPTSLDFNAFASLKTGLSAVGWSVGEVHFMDITSLFPESKENRDIVVEDFNFSSFTGMWVDGPQETAWPTSIATPHRRAASSMLEDRNAAGAASSPVVVLRHRHAKKLYLVDIMAGSLPELAISVSSPTMSSPIDVQESELPSVSGKQNVHPYTLDDAIVPVPLSLMSDPSLTDISVIETVPKVHEVAKTAPDILNVNALDGIVEFAFKDSNMLYVWKKGVVTAITFPNKIASVYSFSPEYAMVTLKNGDKTIKGVLKLVLRGIEASASFAQLPDGITANIVDYVPLPDSDFATKTSGPLTPEELLGTVWVDGDVSGESNTVLYSNTASTKGSSGDVKYMVLEDFDPEQKQLEYRLYPKLPIDTASGFREDRLIVDRRHHQLIDVTRRNATGSDGNSTVRISHVLDTKAHTERAPFPYARNIDQVQVNSGHNTGLVYTNDKQQIATADLDVERIQRRYNDWNTMLNGSAGQIGDGADARSEEHVKDHKMEYSKSKYDPSGTLKHGQEDDKEHHGGNNWAGGTGGTDTAGLGGLVGPYRLDKGHPVHQVSPEDRKKVPKHIVEEAKRMGKEALQQRLSEIGMSEEEYSHYRAFSGRVQPSVTQLRTLLMGLKAAEGERSWVKGQTDGVWDDKKLVEGIVGDKNVYKRRVDSKENNPFQHQYKKRVLFVLDVSASMYRFEGMDQRLSKLLESTIMVMESFAGFESKIDYAMIGHNGDSDCIPLVEFGEPPTNQRERLVVCQKMVAYAQYCWSGDNTVQAMRASLDLVTAQKGDSYFVFVISDANLRQYGITPQELTTIIRSKPEVQMFCIFIATLGAQASSLQKQLPPGHGYECMRTDALPHILRQIFTSVNLL